MLKRYLLFAFDQYDDNVGGEAGVRAEGESLPALALAYEKEQYHYYHFTDILDLEEHRWLSEDEVKSFLTLVN